MASGMVWVRPARFPANVIVAPNSPSARAHVSTAPAASCGATIGRVTRRNTYHGDPPIAAAARSWRRSRPRRPASVASTTSGIDTKVVATTAPAVVNVSWIPSASWSHRPTTPLRPRATSSPTPPTTGGSTIGRTTAARSRLRPGNSPRASTHARGTPTATEIVVAASDTSIDNRSAVDAPTPDRAPASRLQGARTKRATTGRRTKVAPSDASATITRGSRARTVLRRRAEPGVFQRGLARHTDDLVEERHGRFGLRRARNDRDRIGRHDVHRGGDRHRTDGVPGRGDVGGVDDPRVRFPGRDLGDHAGVVVLVGHHVLRRCTQEPCRRERLPRVVTDRDTLRGEDELHPGLREVADRRDPCRIVRRRAGDEPVRREVGPVGHTRR